MNIQALKYEIIEGVKKTEDNSLLELLKTIMDSNTNSSSDWYDDLNPEENASLQRGIRDHEKGEVLTSKEFWAGNED